MLYCPNFFWNVLQVWMTGKDVYLQMTWSWPDKTWPDKTPWLPLCLWCHYSLLWQLQLQNQNTTSPHIKMHHGPMAYIAGVLHRVNERPGLNKLFTQKFKCHYLLTNEYMSFFILWNTTGEVLNNILAALLKSFQYSESEALEVSSSKKDLSYKRSIWTVPFKFSEAIR